MAKHTEYTPYITKPRAHELRQIRIGGKGRELTYHFSNHDIITTISDHGQTIKALALALDFTPSWVRQKLRAPLGKDHGMWLEAAKAVVNPPVIIEKSYASQVLEANAIDPNMHLAEWLLFERAKDDRELAKIIDTLGYTNDFWK
jgi:hypothetical protein